MFIPFTYSRNYSYRFDLSYNICIDAYRMSADNEPPDSSFRAYSRPSLVTVTISQSGMELPPLRRSHTEESPSSPNMHSIAVRSSALPLPQETAWREHRPLNLLSRPRSQLERIELPSIRQVCYFPSIIDTVANNCTRPFLRFKPEEAEQT